MVDKIDGPSPGPARKPDSARTPAATPAGRPGEPVSEASPTTAVRPESEVVESTLLKRAESEVNNAPDVDRQQINRIKEAISNGEFQVDPERVAKAFIELEALLGGGG